MSDDDAALEKKAANLIDHCGPLADQARPDPVQRLQIQLFVGFGWNKACRRPLYRLSYGMGISEIILVPLPKGLCVRGRYLLHVVAQRGKLPSNVVSRHPRFDTDKTGGKFASLDVMRPREISPATRCRRAYQGQSCEACSCPYLFRGWSLHANRPYFSGKLQGTADYLLPDSLLHK